MLKKKYTHIFFDLDNTLWDFKQNSYYALHNAFIYFSLNKKGIEYNNFFEVYLKHNHQLWEEYRRQNAAKNELKELRFQKTFAELNIGGINAGAMNALYLDEMPKQTRLINGAEEILQFFKKKGCALHIITNGFKKVQHKKLKISGLEKYFTKVFISEDVKAPKPDRKIFEYAVKSANAPKNKSLMVGDDFEIDVKGAINFGINAVFFNPGKNQWPHNNGKIIKKDENYWMIASLAELKNIV
ncbi:MAG: YjjG family noncanonical pyrimidine nucleotidase [Tangfeifania sp.]